MKNPDKKVNTEAFHDAKKQYLGGGVAHLYIRSIIGLIMVFDAIFMSRQTRQKLQCLYENLMLNNISIKQLFWKKYEL